MDLGDLQDQSMGVVCLSELVSRFPSIGPRGKGNGKCRSRARLKALLQRRIGQSRDGIRGPIWTLANRRRPGESYDPPGQLLRGQVQSDKSQGVWGTASPSATYLNLESRFRKVHTPSINLPEVIAIKYRAHAQTCVFGSYTFPVSVCHLPKPILFHDLYFPAASAPVQHSHRAQ